MPRRPPRYPRLCGRPPTPSRATAAGRGYDGHHRRWRRAVLKRDPLCVVCLQAGRVAPATVADHVVPIAVDPGRRLDVNNGRGLCATCHGRITARYRDEGVNEPPATPQEGP